ncbi:porphobilinogen deaminase [Methanohalobium evestigatum Z-7303]|uniref:hydroxymethylbilane synthase n=2 Tax=root TaxID=1 RepID=M1QB73_9ZZZZ|nr:hydroxymethylbilane synthase [Methanohalobium evestigatum]ADI73151.1 porphobilinogen deaminase [Methanohalobium evestigatum Z-7303]AGF93248.1 porphobilinogen deaminase [uncultured organism]
MDLIIGTRGSSLALTQTRRVSQMLKEEGVNTFLKIIKTSGDSFTDRPLHELGGVGAFVREIDERMLSGELDIAVHSMKDLPTERPEELPTSAVLKRDSPFDALLTRDGSTLDELPEGAVIGTTSLRRKSQVLRYRPDFDVQSLRGNIDTRLKKLESGIYDGIILAEAGLRRMGWDIPVHQLDTDHFCPSANQGAIAVVAKSGDESENVVSRINHPQTKIETEIERILIGNVGGGCIVPIGAYAEFVNDEKIHIRSEVLALDGSHYVAVDDVISADNYKEEANELGEELVRKGGKKLVQEALDKMANAE